MNIFTESQGWTGNKSRLQLLHKNYVPLGAWEKRAYYMGAIQSWPSFYACKYRFELYYRILASLCREFCLQALSCWHKFNFLTLLPRINPLYSIPVCFSIPIYPISGFSLRHSSLSPNCIFYQQNHKYLAIQFQICCCRMSCTTC